ncbi:MAG: GNAT family N-acetyltransferase [Nitrospinales bacterium]
MQNNLPRLGTAAIVNRKELEALIAGYKYKPYYYEKLIDREKRDSYFMRRVDQASNLCFLRNSEKPPALIGVGSWRESKWDTVNIKLKTACVDFLIVGDGSFAHQAKRCDRLYSALETDLEKHEFEYISCRTNASNLPVIHVLQERGYHVVDGLLIYSLAVKQNPNKFGKKFDIEIREMQESDLPAVRQIASTSFVYDRFHSDPAIPNQTADQLHANWIEDSFKRNANDRVLVATKNGTAFGFVSYSVNREMNQSLGIKILNIILLATHVESRNRGVANLLIQEVLELARMEGFDAVQVGTQLRNIKAARLYQQFNFQLVDTSYSFRKLMPRFHGRNG